MAAAHVNLEKLAPKKNSERLREKKFLVSKAEFGPRVRRQYSVFTTDIINKEGYPELTDSLSCIFHY